MNVSEIKRDELDAFNAELYQDLASANSLEQVTQDFVTAFYRKFEESIILLRAFVTLRMAESPEEIQTFARGLAMGAGVTLDPSSYLLTLFGTAGEEPAWFVRRKSQGHLCIPLATPDFVNSIPMMSALLEELGFDLGWVRGEPEIVANKLGSLSGTFYVSEARENRDRQGRLIIAAQDFVKQYGVRTVFGNGGGFIGTDKFSTVICFLRVPIERERAEVFQTIGTSYRRRAFEHVLEGSFWD